MSESGIFIGNSPIKKDPQEVTGEYRVLNGEEFFQIRNYDTMRPFFMTVVSGSDHWMFISSNGALTAGRRNPDSALFPYYTDDKITDSAEITGSKSLFKVTRSGKTYLWEPFSERYAGVYALTRTIFKNRVGNKIVFEEVNEDLGLAFRYQWTFSDAFGFVKKSSLTNQSGEALEIDFLDGVQNLLPYGVNSDLQNRRSTLVDAYKKNELDTVSGLGIFSLSAMIVDKAEPSESLKATTVWSAGLSVSGHLLCSNQLAAFRKGLKIKEEADVRAERGAYFINSQVSLSAGGTIDWYIVSEVNQTLSKIAYLQSVLADNHDLIGRLEEDIRKSTENLLRRVAMADGLQLTNDKLSSGRHFSNVLFNIMRGGIFEDQYLVETKDLITYIRSINLPVYNHHAGLLGSLPPELTYQELIEKTGEAGDADLERLCCEYLPLSFSRRHGDPSRPWNVFSIDIQDAFGNKIKNYQGNWRDIFQNWEALAFSFPEYVEGMITKFVNASTIDGYNPYRITRDGIDWETIEPDDPWSFIGYWGDHQIIYLLKLLELSDTHHPGRLAELLTKPMNVYANVPYRIRGYADILKDPSDTIDFDHHLAGIIDERISKVGSDGKLVWGADGKLVRANLMEKILVSVLTKLYNFIPEAGIWLNTQRPEWNDANNAVVGTGVSMVTLYYLNRFLKFSDKMLGELGESSVELNQPVAELLHSLHGAFSSRKPLLNGQISDADRKAMMDALGTAGEKYRSAAYAGFNGQTESVKLADIRAAFADALDFLGHSIRFNKRQDGLYHSYNLIEVKGSEAEIGYLYPMLEGQVSVLSSQYLSAEESSAVLNALKSSEMFRPDQYSYMLYPDRTLPLFLEKNQIPDDFIAGSELAQTLLKKKDYSLIEPDINGHYHFNGAFNNANDVKAALDALSGGYPDLVEKEYEAYLAVFEKMFDHKSFTGRSGTFYGYEGLGCIYWHMVSKLLLATQENIFIGRRDGVSPEVMGNLIDHYFEIRAGIGVNKSPDLYGAFPTDAYSHTPGNAGVQQPGMTGQVKEDIINRWAELGVLVKQGCISFEPTIMNKEELLISEQAFDYFDLKGDKKSMTVAPGSLAFTYCQVPVVYTTGEKSRIEVLRADGTLVEVAGNLLSSALTGELFNRTGTIQQITYYHPF